MDYIRDLANSSGFSGAIHLSSGDGREYEEAFGYANMEWSIPNNTGTRFNTASISKVFTACGILKLAEAGRLNLDDRLCGHIRFEGNPFSEEITLEHLLTHTSGIADDADEEAGEEYSELFVSKPNYRFRKAEDLLENFIGKKPVFQPGSGCRYNNAGYVLLGLVLETVTGVEYKRWITENILNPWGLASTCFPAMDGVNENTAEGYIPERAGERVHLRKNIYSIPPVGTPEGGIYSTVSDLNRLIRGISEGRFFSPEYSRLLLTPKVLHSDYGGVQHWMGFGFEFLVGKERILSMKKDGSNPGVSAVMAYYPDSGTGLILLSNTECNVWELQRKIDRQLTLSGER